MIENSEQAFVINLPDQETQFDYEKEIQEFRSIVDNGIKAASELDENLSFIKEKEAQLNLNNPGPSTKYIPLHHSKHKMFVDSMTRTVEFLQNFEKIEEAHKARSYSRLKAKLQQMEIVSKSNRMKLNAIEEMISELKCSYELVDNITSRSSSL